jgi:K+-sensing histidine kinase KdpD
VIERQGFHGATLVLAEDLYLQQVLMNLLSNADKYSPPGKPIEINLRDEGQVVEIAVLDHGDGVSEAELPRIFESFYRSAGTAQLAPGKGLGLTVCKRLVEAMGGEIMSRHRDGGGLVMIVRLQKYSANSARA